VPSSLERGRRLRAEVAVFDRGFRFLPEATTEDRLIGRRRGGRPAVGPSVAGRDRASTGWPIAERGAPRDAPFGSTTNAEPLDQ
jgi:hypothetical protein